MSGRKPVILISTYGGHRLGTGHIFRDLELARSLRAKARVVFHANASGGAVRILSDRGVKRVLAGPLATAVRAANPDIIIYDKPNALGPIRGADKRGTAKLIALDYFYYHDANVDAAINIKNHHIGKSMPGGIRRIYEGLRHAIIRKEILRHRGNKRPAGNGMTNILITFGGADPRNNTRKAMELLDGLTSERFNVVVILGPVFKKGLKYPFASSLHKYVFKQRVLRMGPLMQWADLVFCGGGTTMMEALSLGSPVVVMPQTREEHALARGLQQKNAVVLVEPRESTRHARKTVETLLGSPWLRRRMSLKGKKIFDGKGVVRIVRILFRELGTI